MFLVACGHPASTAECEELQTKNAEIALRSRNITDPKQIAERVGAARAARGEEFLKRCIGKRITAGAIRCVRNATTTEQLDRCF